MSLTGIAGRGDRTTPAFSASMERGGRCPGRGGEVEDDAGAGVPTDQSGPQLRVTTPPAPVGGQPLPPPLLLTPTGSTPRRELRALYTDRTVAVSGGFFDIPAL